MISVQVLSDEGIVIAQPSGHLEEKDFQTLEKEIETIIEDKGRLTGLIIHTKSFPGWDDFRAFQHHIKFVKEHHRHIKRVAIVTDSKLGEIGPSIARHFVSAEIKHFPWRKLDEAKQWIKESV